MNDITENMIAAIKDVAYGVRLYSDGYRSIETHQKVDGRSLAALRRRGLINWIGTGGSTAYIRLELTESGQQIFDESST